VQKSAELDRKESSDLVIWLGASLVVTKMTTEEKLGIGKRCSSQRERLSLSGRPSSWTPDGPWGPARPKQGLEQLELMKPGIDTKVNVRKKKS